MNGLVVTCYYPVDGRDRGWLRADGENVTVSPIVAASARSPDAVFAAIGGGGVTHLAGSLAPVGHERCPRGRRPARLERE